MSIAARHYPAPGEGLLRLTRIGGPLKLAVDTLPALPILKIKGTRHVTRTWALAIQKLPLYVATCEFSSQACHSVFDDPNLGEQWDMLVAWCASSNAEARPSSWHRAIPIR